MNNNDNDEMDLNKPETPADKVSDIAPDAELTAPLGDGGNLPYDNTNKLVEEDVEGITEETYSEEVYAEGTLQEETLTEETYREEIHQQETPTIIAPPPPALTRAQWLQLYLIGAIACNFFVLFFDGHFDIGFWKNWTTHLATAGFTDYRGDYPPLWSDWLYIVSRFYIYFNLPIENNILFKHLTQIPVGIYHLLLIYLIYRLVNANSKNEVHFHAALALTAFNPAILFNGPLWGQIDVAPLVPLIAAIMAGTSKRFQMLMIPFYMLAMLTKFQMIGFAPVMGILFFRSIKQHLIGLAISIPIFILAFLPAIVSDNFIQAFSLPYIGSVSMFSAATMSAANIWILVAGNHAPDNIVLFGIDPTSPFASLFTIRHVGMISFSIICLFVFIAGMKKLAVRGFEQNQEVSRSDMFFYAMVCTTTFFTILPGMHERYLLPAAIVALAYYAISPTKAFYAVALTLISAINLTMTHGIKTSSIWPSLSWIMLAVFVHTMLDFLFGQKWTNLFKKVLSVFLSIKWISVWVLIATITITTYILYKRNEINASSLAPHQVLLTNIQPYQATQDYGSLQINLNVTGNPINIGGKRYAHGFGTHANSSVSFNLPDNAISLSFIAGLDTQVEAADVTFSVWGDGRLLWQSPVIQKSEKDASVTTVDITGVKDLNLQVSGMGNIGSDHANWAEPIITFKQ